MEMIISSIITLPIHNSDKIKAALVEGLERPMQVSLSFIPHDQKSYVTPMPHTQRPSGRGRYKH